MTVITKNLAKLQNFYEVQAARLQANAHFIALMALPPMQRWLSIAGLFLLSQLVVFGSLYILFGKLVVIGFLASILAGLATGLGALPVLFFKNISNNLFSSLLGAAAGIMLAATAFSLLVPGIHFGNVLWPGNGIYVVSAGMLLGAFFLHYADSQLPHPHFDAVVDTQINSMRKIWLFAHAIRRFGAVPTLIERDANLPELAALVAEAATADAVLASAPTTGCAEMTCAG